MIVIHASVMAPLARHERDAIEPRHAGADVELSRHELVVLVTPAVELPSGATLNALDPPCGSVTRCLRDDVVP